MNICLLLRKLIFKLTYLNLKFANSYLICLHNILNKNLKIFTKNLILKAKFNLDKNQIISLENEIINDFEIKKKFETRADRKIELYEDKIKEDEHLIFLYSVIRITKPKRIVTSGVALGFQEAVILSALNKNNIGQLVSIDLLGKKDKLTYDKNLESSETGFFIPNEYKNRWKLIIGDAREKLIENLNDLHTDIFIHDSNHTVSHMNFEYACARLNMKENKLIFSDDILIFNNVFENFLQMNNLVGYATYPKLNYGFFENKFDNFEKKNSLINYSQK